MSAYVAKVSGALQPVVNFSSRALTTAVTWGKRSVSVAGEGFSKIAPALSSAWAATANFFQAAAKLTVNFFSKNGKSVSIASLIALALAGIGYVAYRALGKKAPADLPKDQAKAPADEPAPVATRTRSKTVAMPKIQEEASKELEIAETTTTRRKASGSGVKV